jgi:hypothetical protein
MSQVQIVSPNYVYQVWDKVEPYIIEALKKSSGEYNADQLKVLVTQGQQIMLVAVSETDGIHGVCTLEFVNYPNDRIAYVTCFGGVDVANSTIWSQFEAWMKDSGATKFRAATFESAARLYNRAFGTTSKYILVEKDL